MADVVTRLVVESKEYDSKIARATQGLTQFEKKCREVGGTLEFVEKEDLDFVKALGQMETVSSSATGKLSELKKAFTELSVQYKNLTDAEKQAPYGKALAASLDQLKGRIKNAEGDLRSVRADLSDFGDKFKELGAKIGIPSQMFSTLGITIAAAGAAIKIGTDAFKKNEEMLDDWNATVAGAQSIYESFLVSLNTGDFSCFLLRMSNVSRAAREAYDALDKLGTFNAFNQINLQRAQTQFTEAVASYREGTGSKSEVRAAADAWKNELETRRKMEQDAYLAKIREIAASRGVDADLLTKALSGNYGDYETLKATQMPTKSVYNSSTRSFNDVIDNDAATEVQKLGQALRQLNDTQLQEIQALGRQAQATATEIAQVDRQTVRMLGKSGGGGGKGQEDAVLPEGSAAALKKQIADLRDAWNKATTQEDRDSIKGQIDAANEALKAMTPQIEPVAAAIKDAAAMWTEHSEKIADVKARLEEFKAMVTDTSLTDAQREWAQGMADAYQEQLDKMTGATEEAANNMSNSLKEIPTQFELVREELGKMSSGIDAISTLGNSLDQLKGIGEDLAAAFSGEMDAWDALMTVFNSGIGIMQTVIGVMEAINTLTELSTALKGANTVATQTEATTAVTAAATEAGADSTKAAANMATAGTAAAASSAEAGESVAGIPIVGPILAVAAIAAVLAATFAAMSKAKSAGKFATGGLIPGNSFSGDNLTANVNSGELILNRAQQGAIAGQLAGNPMDNLNLSMEVEGTKMLVLLNNVNRSLGGSRDFYTKRH